MGLKTSIAWCDSTVNEYMGCDGCELWNANCKKCYAGILTRIYGGFNKGFPVKFERVEHFPGRMEKATKWSDLLGKARPDKPWLNGLPRHIFLGDMGDLLSPQITFSELRRNVLEHVRSEAGSRHVWMLLTKRGKRLLEFDQYLQDKNFDWPSNLYAGVSVTTQPTVKRVDYLVKTRAPVKYVSYEPAWASVDLKSYMKDLDLLIVGGESGQSPEPFDPQWAREQAQVCIDDDTALFMKQFGSNPVHNGKKIQLHDPKGEDWDEWPDEWNDIKKRELLLSADWILSRKS